jgi:hypothetical protein
MFSLIRTDYDLQSQHVTCTLNLSVQSNAVQITCTFPISELLANAAKDNRADWNTQDCRDLATTAVGQVVN